MFVAKVYSLIRREFFKMLRMIASVRMEKLRQSKLEKVYKVGTVKSGKTKAKAEADVFKVSLWKYELKQIAITLAKLQPEMVAVGQSSERLEAVATLALEIARSLTTLNQEK